LGEVKTGETIETEGVISKVDGVTSAMDKVTLELEGVISWRYRGWRYRG